MPNNAGIYITQVGASVPTAADYQFVFNSDWPSLQVALDVTVDIPAGGSVTIPHTLGFYPLTFAYLTSGGSFIGRASIANVDVAVYIGKKGIYLSNVTGPAYTANVKCYNIDLTKQVDYTLPKYPAVRQPYDPTVGIKVSKYGKQINSTDLRDFILHSRAQSPAILSVVTEKSATTSPIGVGLKRLSYTNPAGYIPWITGYVGVNTTILEPLVYKSASWSVQSVGLTISSNVTTLDFDLTQGGAALVILRDPLIVANPVQVTY
jgi:hypothetical protein